MGNTDMRVGRTFAVLIGWPPTVRGRSAAHSVRICVTRTCRGVPRCLTGDLLHKREVQVREMMNGDVEGVREGRRRFPCQFG